MSNSTLLAVEDLRVFFNSPLGTVKAVDGVDFQLKHGESVALVGESGCGKSVTSLSIMGLVASPPGELKSGRIKYSDKNLLEMNEKEMRVLRGNEISMIFQDPMSSLNPVVRIGAQIVEVLRIHKDISKKAAHQKAIQLLTRVGISRPGEIANAFPHQISGGMKQRVMIAIALACKPRLLIADEPTTALDVTIQAQIMDLIKELIQDLNMTLLLITHDLGLVADTCERVIVMYAGKIVEEANVKALFRSPRHPYTVGLLKAIPSLNNDRDKRLYTIPGTVPIPLELPQGCAFSPRCKHATPRCSDELPPVVELENSRRVCCWLFS